MTLLEVMRKLSHEKSRSKYRSSAASTQIGRERASAKVQAYDKALRIVCEYVISKKR